MTKASSNPVRDAPAFGLNYSGTKGGKTTDALYSFPCAYYIATPAALKPSEKIVGFSVHPNQVKEVARISDATKIVKTLGKDFDSCVVDDFSLLAERTFALLEGSKSGFKLWGALRNEVIEFRDAARSCGKHIILTCHEAPPQVKNGWNVRGGPRLPGRLPEELPAQCDFVLRGFYDPSRRGPWPMVYRCSPNDTGYISGDRFGVTPDHAPMNLGEIFRAAGFKVKRAPGLDWMEAVVEQGATMLTSNPADKEVEILRAMMGHIVAKFTKDPRHIAWALRDARDRVALRLAQTRILDSFFTPPNAFPTFGVPAPAPAMPIAAPAPQLNANIAPAQPQPVAAAPAAAPGAAPLTL